MASALAGGSFTTALSAGTAGGLYGAATMPVRRLWRDVWV